MRKGGIMLEIMRLNVHYGSFQALHNISLQVRQGSVVSIIGSNGAGKSTLLNTILGFNKPSSGAITFLGDRLNGMLTHKIVEKGLTMSPEGSKVFQKMTVKENLLMGAYLPHARRYKDETLKLVYELFPVLQEKAQQGASYLSGGQRQMLAISRAIMSKPKLLVCDEISLGLAPVIIKDIYHTIQKISQRGLTIVLVEQDVRRSLQYSDYSYVMLKGKIVLEGSSGELNEDEVKDAYFGMNKYAKY
jgi:branched-chain amino acid transport system ATP-binding protein